MLKRKLIGWSLLGAMAVILVTACIQQATSRPKSAASSESPIQFNPVTNLGAVRRGSTLTASIELANSGGDLVTLKNFHASCSCTQVYTKDRTGNPVEVGELRLGPGEHVTVHTTIQAGGDVGTPQISQVFFDCEGATRESLVAAVRYLPTIDLYPLPKSLHFGLVDRRDGGTQTFDLMSNGKFSEPIKEVMITPHPDFQLTATFRRPEDASSEVVFADPLQRRLGLVDFKLKPISSTEDYAGVAKLMINGHLSIDVPVTYRVAEEFHLSPNIITLPSHGKDGADYVGKVICTSRSGQKFTLEHGETPEAFEVKINQTSDQVCTILVRFDPHRGADSGILAKHKLTFLLRTEEDAVSLPLTVLIANLASR